MTHMKDSAASGEHGRISFDHVSKVFAGAAEALSDFSLSFEKGEFIVFLGPSGSGKTTACRILAGLERPTAGRIYIDDRDITDLPPRARAMSMVFQNYALYSHRSVFGNIAYPLKLRGIRGSELERRVRDTARMLQIEKFLNRKPAQLSGGQAQRVAVARALVWEPEICLMDEPLSNLDALLRLQTRTELKRLHRELGKTFVFVTHDQEEAMTLGTRIAVLDSGKMVQFGPPKEIYHKPATRFVAEFIGRPAMNTFGGEIQNETFVYPDFTLPVKGMKSGLVTLGIRPESIQVVPQKTTQTITVAVDVVEHIEPDVLVFVKCGASGFVLRLFEEIPKIKPGDELHLLFPRYKCHFFDEAGLRIAA